MKRVCVYCGSADHLNPAYLEAARAMGQALARNRIEMWYGAGSTGLMGAVADGALDAGGVVVGVIPQIFNNPRLCHQRLTRLEVVETMHVRKARLAEAADAFIALPGGYGTFEELFEILTWAQIGLHRKPIGVLNVGGYFNPLLEMVEQARREGFIYSEHRGLFTTSESPEALLESMANHRPPEGVERWLRQDVE